MMEKLHSSHLTEVKTQAEKGDELAHRHRARW